MNRGRCGNVSRLRRQQSCLQDRQGWTIKPSEDSGVDKRRIECSSVVMDGGLVAICTSSSCCGPFEFSGREHRFRSIA